MSKIVVSLLITDRREDGHLKGPKHLVIESVDIIKYFSIAS